MIATDTDTDFLDGTITEANWIEDTDGWSVAFKEGVLADYEMGFNFLHPYHITGWEPKVGDAIRVYGFGDGDGVRGVVVNDTEIFYYTEEEWAVVKKINALYSVIETLEDRLTALIEGRDE